MTTPHTPRSRPQRTRSDERARPSAAIPGPPTATPRADPSAGTRPPPREEASLPGPAPPADEVQRVLIVEDDATFAKLLTAFIRQSRRPRCRSVTANSMQDALERLRADSYDIIITDLRLPDSKDYNTVESLQRAAPDVPIVVLTGTAEEGISSSLEAVRRGAAYFLRKGNVDAAAIERGIRYARDRSHLRDLLGGDPAVREEG